MKLYLILGLCMTSVWAVEEPESLTKLRSGYEDAMARAVAPVNARYIQELEKLKLQYTKAGKLEEALAVDAELKKQSATKFSIIGKWKYFRNDKSESITDISFESDGSAIYHRSNLKGTWSYEDEKIIIKWSNGFTYTIDDKANQLGSELTGKESSGSVFTMKRISGN